MSKKNPFPVSTSRGHNSHKRFAKGAKVTKKDHVVSKVRLNAMLTNPHAIPAV